MRASLQRWAQTYPSVPYVLPFVSFLAFLAISSAHLVPVTWEAPVWVLAFALLCYLCWPPELPVRPIRPVGSVLVGLLVLVIWIAPETLVPGYRENGLFSNSILGHVHSSIPEAALRSPWVLTWRTLRAALIVPIVEELFWRGWLMRWLINPDFRRVPIGSYRPVSFWVTALLFASEHGPYWDVGLLAGLLYNWWCLRTKSIADCILAHAITNLALSLFVIRTAQWQYWQ